MRLTVIRTVASALVLTFAVGTGAAIAASPEPTQALIGARVAGYVIADENPAAYVINDGNVTMTFEATAPDGWNVTPKSLTLEPGDSGDFLLAGSGDSGLMKVIGYSAAAMKATGDVSKIEFGSIKVMQTRPFDWTRLIAPVTFGLLIIAAILFLLWRFKPWQYRLTRSDPRAA